MASPYSRPSPIRVKCVLNRRNAKTLNFKLVNGEIRPGNQEVTYLSALSTGGQVYVTQSSSDSAAFEEGVTYYIKNYTVSSRYGQQRLFMGPNTTTYKTAPLTLTFDAEKMAKDALIPPSVSVTGDEQDLFSRGCYLTLEGTVEHMQVPRMTTVRDTEVPILDLGIRSGSRVLEVSLWRDQALTKLQINDKINICHLRANAKASKFNSTAYTTVEVLEQGPVVENIVIIGLSEANGEVSLLAEDFSEYTACPELLEQSPEELLCQLPLHLEVVHDHRKIQKINYVDEL
ncbi:Hydroxycinnamoyl-CoA hydratase-lyase [Labeo rohita]|uniref:Hydroxycinnamoyl-CoA hydratase-lyase n=1 Tax=Labeo rohita TaxID=84645 RepID=A0ABQ8LBK1_LABRO|nr:Hydroxycinnamoyl-CoA hydratase-lyase [Labeo rohita]